LLINDYCCVIRNNRMSQSFSLHVVLENSCNATTTRNELNEAVGESDTCFVAHASSFRISQPQNHDSLARESSRFALIFVPATIVDSSLEQQQVHIDPNPQQFTLLDTANQRSTSERLLSMVHPFLAQNFPLKAILQIRNQQHAPADIVLLDLSHTPPAAIADLIDHTSFQMLHSGPDAILKILLIHRVRCYSPGDDSTAALLYSHDIPSCPVCLHRIDPWRLGLHAPRGDHLCSKFCPPPNLTFSSSESSCPRQRLLDPWPFPAQCTACHVIRKYWNRDTDEARDLFCHSCAMQETLWVCLTCAFIGCGRYSNKHAEQHYRDSGHPFCLELSTLRMWDYVNGEFAHRLDLLECPSSPPLMHPWIPAAGTQASAAGYSSQSSDDNLQADHDDHHRRHHHHFASMPSELGEKSPKKATMIGEEYEALLQSALEEQAQHYEGEITRLRAELTESRVDKESISEQEQTVIDNLRLATTERRAEIGKVGRNLVDLQSQEAGHRAASQRLLREQQVAQDLLKHVRVEIEREQKEGKIQADELEQQIAELEQHQRMCQQFSQDEELSNAQIVGTTGTESDKSSSKKGKKSRRFFRK
jgi:hypothetical protein